ncbi:hypothetical protein XELAEV_18025152mg [Xenopus laevis]|uniref:Uncharacterized protein n=1 Tax=Xenopus laevis TaxID=8355 RepID=A0A974HM31_XENLA|nr:hypothetical protein XELAEV_18025152mg [Xenopus laevis]
MDKRFCYDSELTCLQKLLLCMKKTIGNTASPLITEEFLHRIKEYFRTSYKNSRESNQKTEEHDPCKQNSDAMVEMG